MSETLLLPSANTETAQRKKYVRIVLVAIGLVVVLYGAADVLARVAHAALGSDANIAAFAPAIELDQTTAFASSTTPIMPTRLVIPAIGVDANIEQVGKKSDGSMATPATFGDVAWYDLGSKPGSPGNAVIAGHVNNALTKTGVFENLSDLKVGDVIALTDANGNVLHFAVRDIEDYTDANAPLSTIFSTTGPSQVVLITCAGDWDPVARSYDHRLVIFAGLLAQ